MKKLITALILTSCLLSPRIFSQKIYSSFNIPYSQMSYANNPPLWHYSVIDSSIIGDTLAHRYIADGYNSLHPHTIYPPQSYVLGDDALYLTQLSYGHSLNILYGGVIQKIDLRNGKTLWSYAFDDRSYDDEYQEYLTALYLSGDSLIVVSTRRLKKPNEYPFYLQNSYYINGEPGYMQIRILDKNTGELIQNTTNDTGELIAPQLNLFSASTLFCNGDNSFQLGSTNYHLNTLKLYYLNEQATIIDSFDYQLNYTQGSKKLLFDGGQYFQVHRNRAYYLAATHIKNLSKEQQLFLSCFNNQLKLMNTYDLSFIIDSIKHHFDYTNNPDIEINNFWLSSVEDDIASFTIALHDTRILLTYSFICMIDLKSKRIILSTNRFPKTPDERLGLKQNYGIITGYYLNHSKKYILIGTTESSIRDRAKNCSMDFYLLDKGRWELKHSIKFTENFLHFSIDQLRELDNSDILLTCRTAIYSPEKDSLSRSNDTWMRIDGRKLGLITETTNIDRQHIRMTVLPNPAKEKVQIQLNKPVNANLLLVDSKGYVTKSFKLNNSMKITLDLSDIPAGVFLLKLNSSQGEKIVNKIIHL